MTGSRPRSASGSVAAIAFGVLGTAWFALELAAPLLGFADTDSPTVTIAYLRTYPALVALGGVVLVAASIALACTVLAVADALVAGPRLAARPITAFGLFASAFLVGLSVTKFGGGPLAHIDGLDHAWGEAFFLALLMFGIHGMAQGAILTMCLWAVGASVVGWRAGVLPGWLAALAVVPAIRLLGLAAPFGVLPDGLWLPFMLSIPGTMLWFVALGIALRGEARGAEAIGEALAASAVHR